MLNVDQISFKYENKTILDRLSFKIAAGEHVSVIGESGSGKSTLLKLIHGEYDLDEGHIFWKDHEILGPKFNLVVGLEFMKYVAQEFELMPFVSVEENVGKFLSNFFPEQKHERVKELLEVVELTDYAKTKVKTLSGGQKQRVALARAIAKQPEIILLDEPFSHIDSFKKQSLRRKLFKYLKKKQISCVVATHDKDDVMGYADRMLVLNRSKIIADNTPEQLFRSPSNPLIASFFAEFNQIDDQLIYAHQIRAVDHSDIQGIIKHSYFKGTHYLIEADVKGNRIYFTNDIALSKEQPVFLEIIT